MDAVKALMNKVTEILSYCKNIDNKLNDLHNEHIQLSKIINNRKVTNMKSVIPYMTPKQLYSLNAKGWTVEELTTISGYTAEEVTKKVNNYINA